MTAELVWLVLPQLLRFATMARRIPRRKRRPTAVVSAGIAVISA
jgi:hypothetical protein